MSVSCFFLFCTYQGILPIETPPLCVEITILVLPSSHLVNLIFNGIPFTFFSVNPNSPVKNILPVINPQTGIEL